MYVYSQKGVYYSALFAGSPQVTLTVESFLLEIRLNIPFMKNDSN